MVFGTAEKKKNNVTKACIQTVFETIWNCKNEKILKTLIVSKACVLTLFTITHASCYTKLSVL